MAQEGVGAVEMDIYFTKDKVPVVFHGDNWGRFEQSYEDLGIEKGMKMKDVYYDQVRRIDLGSD